MTNDKSSTLQNRARRVPNCYLPFVMGHFSLVNPTTFGVQHSGCRQSSFSALAKALIDAPAGGAGMIDGLRQALIGEDPFEVEKLWYKMYKASVYYGRRGVAIQALAGIDNCLWSIIGQFVRQPLFKLLGAHRRNRVRAYASTLFRPTPEAM